MATLWEQKKAEQAAAFKQKKLIGSVAGTVVQIGKQASFSAAIAAGGHAATSVTNFNAASGWAAVIELVGTIGVAAWSFMTQKKQRKKRERRLKGEEATQTSVSGILAEVEETGLAIIEQHGIDPTSADFEKVLYDTLFQKIGYRGNCNATVWQPGSKPSKNRPVSFYITGNGRKFTPGTASVPPNLQTFWYVQCKNARDRWIIAYTDLLIQQGRLQELENFQASLKKGQRVVQAVFAIIFLIIGIIVFINSTKIKV